MSFYLELLRLFLSCRFSNQRIIAPTPIVITHASMLFLSVKSRLFTQSGQSVINEYIVFKYYILGKVTKKIKNSPPYSRKMGVGID
jgi:hypothetical protein